MKKKMPWEPAEFEICEGFEDIVTLSGDSSGSGTDIGEDDVYG